MTGRNHKTGVIGAGLMGTDIAALLANAGYEVSLVDIDEGALQSARRKHKNESLRALEDVGLKKRDEIVSSITYTTDIGEVEGSQFIVEAINERLKHKIDLMKDLEKVISERTVIGSNTSTLTPTEISKGMDTPERVVLFHFANPAIPRKLIEISGDNATEKAIKTATALGENIGKHSIRLDRERRGHVLSRISAAVKCAASWELVRADPASIDRGAKTQGFQRGPVELMDLIGLDVHLETVSNLSEVFSDRFEPPIEVKNKMSQMVDSRKLGKKSGEGFYRWDENHPIIPDVETEHDITPIIAALVNEAHKIVADGIANRDTVDEILKLGSGGSVGPFEVGELLGHEKLRKILEERYRETGSDLFKTADSLAK